MPPGLKLSQQCRQAESHQCRQDETQQCHQAESHQCRQDETQQCRQAESHQCRQAETRNVRGPEQEPGFRLTCSANCCCGHIFKGIVSRDDNF